MTDSSTAAYQPPKPHPALKKLDFLVGNWELKGRLTESPVGQAGTLEGWQTFEWLKGEYFLVHRWGTAGEGLGEGVEYFGYDEARKQFKTHFFDNLGPYAEEGSTYEGNFEGKTLVLTGPARVYYTPNDDGTVTFVLKMAKDFKNRGSDAPESDFTEYMKTTLTRTK